MNQIVKIFIPIHILLELQKVSNDNLLIENKLLICALGNLHSQEKNLNQNRDSNLGTPENQDSSSGRAPG